MVRVVPGGPGWDERRTQVAGKEWASQVVGRFLVGRAGFPIVFRQWLRTNGISTGRRFRGADGGQ